MEKLPHNHNNEINLNLVNELKEIENFTVVADTFKILFDANRVRVFWLLCHYEECVINISALLDMSSPAISHHLKLLKSSGLITSRRCGKEVYYKASNTQVSNLLHNVIEKIMNLTCPTE